MCNTINGSHSVPSIHDYIDTSHASHSYIGLSAKSVTVTKAFSNPKRKYVVKCIWYGFLNIKHCINPQSIFSLEHSSQDYRCLRLIWVWYWKSHVLFVLYMYVIKKMQYRCVTDQWFLTMEPLYKNLAVTNMTKEWNAGQHHLYIYDLIFS